MARAGAMIKRLTRRYDLTIKGNIKRGMSYGSNLRDKGYHVEFHQDAVPMRGGRFVNALLVEVYPRKKGTGTKPRHSRA